MCDEAGTHGAAGAVLTATIVCLERDTALEELLASNERRDFSEDDYLDLALGAVA